MYLPRHASGKPFVARLVDDAVVVCMIVRYLSHPPPPPHCSCLHAALPLPQVSLAYDVDMSEGGMLGAGAYGTVMAAVHRSTGRQVAIKTMLKKYLLTDAEKSSVEREIEIQKVRVSVTSSHCSFAFDITRHVSRCCWTGTQE